jgi:[acyl-carrier-protein] S-malonyltransferase/trans-AT polyketide synthase/acyltransferase/oxidoreductase domain-containing protein
MAKVAFVFPGQGSQRAGMARDFCDSFAASREVFQEASEALGLDVQALCFDDDPRLDLTEFTQPAILTAEIAMLRAIEQEFGLAASLFGGHSLGEFTALCAAGAVPFPVAVRLVRQRGALMQAAVPAGEGAMVAVCGAGVAALDIASAIHAEGIDVANENSPDQVVLSGPAAAMDRACARVRNIAHGIELDLVPLTVSAPFHSRRMRAIEADFRRELDQASPRFVPERSAVVTSNFRGEFHSGQRDELLGALEHQIGGTVRWVANMRALMAVADRIIEIGPGRPLRGFFKSLGVEITSIVSCKTAEKAVAA